MKIYHYSPVTSEFTREGTADPSPREPGKYLLPRYSTAIKPPLVGTNEVAVFENGRWKIEIDFRGTKYYFPDGTEGIIEKIGELIPSGSSLTPPVQRSVLLEKIKQERDRRWAAGFPVSINGDIFWFHSHPFNLIQYLGLKDLARDAFDEGGSGDDVLKMNGFDLEWHVMGGRVVPITLKLSYDIVDASRLQQAHIFAVSVAHEQAIISAADPSDYDIYSGWPKVYGE